MKQQYNYELFEKILNHINENPQSFNITTWKEESECGTTMCIAGLACGLSGLDDPDFSTHLVSVYKWYFNNGYQLLNLTYDEAETLFYMDDEEYAINVLEEIVSDKYKEDQRTITHIHIELENDYIFVTDDDYPCLDATDYFPI